MKKVLGVFYYKANNSTLQEELKGGPNVEMAKMHKKRLIVYSEPSKSKMLNTDVIKDLTGGIEMNARLNHSNNTECQLHGTHILLCNNKPLLNDTDGGTSRRIIDFPFRSLFVDSKDMDNYKGVENVYNRVEEYSVQDFWDEYRCAIFKYLLRYKNQGILNIPDGIKERSNEYLCDSDYILCWMKDNYEEYILDKEDEKSVKKILDIYEEFKESDYYKNSDRKKKRELSDSNFIKTLSTHNKYKKYYIEEYRYYDENKNRKKIRNVLKNLRRIEQ
jgi:phage/plasmid-associated DNA primase